MRKNSQIDLEQSIAEANEKLPFGTITDAFTGEVVPARASNHYEANDGVPVAPRVDLPRVSLRQRIENLLNRGIDPRSQYVHDGLGDMDFEVPDDPEAPLTQAEETYIEMVANSVAEQASEGDPESQPAAAAPKSQSPEPPSPTPPSPPPATGGTGT